jgi:hypothetical protein
VRRPRFFKSCRATEEEEEEEEEEEGKCKVVPVLTFSEYMYPLLRQLLCGM